MELIKLKDITKTYRMGELYVPVLKGVSLTIHKGEMVALMGASGSGKSTLMNILGCLDRPTGGEYWFDGKDVSNLSKDDRALVRSQKMGFVFQSFNLLARTSALDNVLMPMTYAPGFFAGVRAGTRARLLLEKVGLTGRFDHTPAQLSGGQQQRVAIARALINDPPLLFADEPTGNLDSKTSEEILGMFKELNVEHGLTVVLVTHDLNVAQVAGRTITIKDGLIDPETSESAGPQGPGTSKGSAGSGAKGGGEAA